MGTSLMWQTNTQLHEAVQRQIDWEPEIDPRQIALLAADGVITLTGFVGSYVEKLAAERAVKQVRGVRAVANDIQVALRDERTDPDIANDAVHALRADSSVPSQITVTVRHGFVTLEGAVEWMYQKAAAGSAVMSLKGVKGVSNIIRIRPKLSAVDIRVDIEEALRRSAVIDARGIRIAVDGSTISLSGSVHSWAEKHEAERAAWAAPGVSDVDNDIVVTL
jgi:osmotically-inducible protein OsmY